LANPLVVDARQTWQALQARLTAARAAADAGDRQRALNEITAPLDIDPNFLAAHSLRERILDNDKSFIQPSPPAAMPGRPTVNIPLPNPAVVPQRTPIALPQPTAAHIPFP